MIHDLKIDKEYLHNLLFGGKKSEIRYNDRDYQYGDILRFKEYTIESVKEHLFEVRHIHSGLGMADNYVVLSVRLIEDPRKLSDGLGL